MCETKLRNTFLRASGGRNFKSIDFLKTIFTYFCRCKENMYL